MKKLMYRAAVSGAVLAFSLVSAGAHAQLGNLLNKSGTSSGGLSGLTGGGASGGMGGLGSLLSGSGAASSSSGNVAGVLQYCIQNNYLSGNSASSVKDSLMSKLGGSSSASSDSGFQDGSSGVLDGGNGQKFDLSNIQGQVKTQVCNKVLSQAKSLL